MPDDSPAVMLPEFTHQPPADGEHGNITIRIINARHFADVLSFAEKVDGGRGFQRCWLSLLGLAAGYGASTPAFTHTRKDEAGNEAVDCYPPRPGTDAFLEIHPEGFCRQSSPSFEWRVSAEGRGAMNGGMNFHQSDRSWTLNT